MPAEYNQTQRIQKVKGDAHYHYHESPPPAPPRPPFRRWGLVGAAAAVLLAGGTLATTQLSAQTVYYCGSRNTVKYHTDATCPALQQCGGRVRSMPVGRAKHKMDLCRACH